MTKKLLIKKDAGLPEMIKSFRFLTDEKRILASMSKFFIKEICDRLERHQNTEITNVVLPGIDKSLKTKSETNQLECLMELKKHFMIF